MDQPKILVAIRKRPLSKKEEAKGETDIVSVKNNQTVIVSQYKQKVDLTKYLEETVFNFDFAYDQETNNEQIYDSAVRPLVDSAFQGAKVTCFAYGQTGSGKTFTMNGNAKLGVTGLYALGAQDIFSYLENPNFSHLKAKVSFFEIYCGKLFDLLNKRQQLKILQDKKNNINIIGIEESHITCWEEFLQLLEYGSTQRITSQNSANAESSRSHAILQISLKEGKKLFGKISFIDLAGNERGADHTDMKKQTRIDGAEINKSLLSLKECIRALDQGKGHTPFRGSKLTMVLKDSFVGFCRTVMIGNVSPSSGCSENTLNTLRYADRVKQLRKPTESATKEELKARQMMLPRQTKNAIKISINNDDDAEQIQAKRQLARGNYGIKDDGKKRQRSNDPYLFRPIEQRPRQQSFGTSKNQTKGQNFDVKKQKLTQIAHQPPIKPIKQPNTTSATKLTMGNNSKKVLAYHEKSGEQNNFRSHAPRTNSLQPQIPKPIFHANRGADMDIEEEYFVSHDGQFKVKPLNNFTSNQSTNYDSAKTDNSSKGYHFEALRPTNENFGYRNGGNNYMMPPSPYQTQEIKTFQKPPVMPTDWDSMDEFVRNSNETEAKEKVREKMQELLYTEENELMNSHSDCLRTSLDIIKGEMNMLSKLESNRQSLSTREYVKFMEESIDEKISALEMLREQMAHFSYKLDVMEQIEGATEKADDEQLLDDLH